jgi:hypothetical protein
MLLDMLAQPMKEAVFEWLTQSIDLLCGADHDRVLLARMAQYFSVLKLDLRNNFGVAAVDCLISTSSQLSAVL